MTATDHNDPPQRMMKPSDDQKTTDSYYYKTKTGNKSRNEHGGVDEGRNEERRNKDGALVTMRCWSPARVALLLVSMKPRCGRLRSGESVGFGTGPEAAWPSLRVTGRVGKLMRSGFQCCADTGGALFEETCGWRARLCRGVCGGRSTENSRDVSGSGE